MASEDDLVIELLNRQLDSNIKVAMTYGGDEIDNYRFQNQWGIKHLLIPGNQGGGINARINAHLQFINQFTLGDCKDSGTTENCDNFDTDRALLIGQSSYQYVVRLETAPLQERTYQVLSGKFNVKDKDEQAYEVKQVGGQMFVPAKFLSHWGVPVSLGSVIGYDEFGMEIRRQLYELDNIDWRYTEMASEIVTDHSYVVTFAGVRTIIDGRAGIKDSRIADRFIKRINEDLSSGQLTPKVIYLSKWYLESCKSILSKSNSTKGLKPLIAYETGTRGSEDPQSYEGSILGDSCDVVLSSSLFAMRIARLPLSSPETRKIGYKTDDTTTIAQWDSQFKNYQPKNTTNKTYQNDALAIGLKNVGCIKFHERLFSSIFPNASWWVITMGEGGMILFNRSCPSYGTWIPSPKVDVVNALGCGDVSRAGFITWFMKSGLNREEFLNSEKAVITAAKFAVAAGSYKTEYFSIDTAAQYLTWDYLTEKVLSLTETRLNDEQSIEKLGTALS
jgi:hypothetical protein